jgi:hypothetical protein
MKALEAKVNPIKKKNRRVTPEEYETIQKLASEGKNYRQIMALTGRSNSSISWILNGNKPSFARCIKSGAYKSKYDHKDLEEADLSILPDTVLFKHNREYFI